MKIGKFLRLACAACIVTFGLGTQLVWAVHDQDFELEGNIIEESGVDWESLFIPNGSGASPKADDDLPAGFGPATFVRDFIPGKKGPDDSTFATGSKDTLNITGGWECTSSNNLGAKVNIINIYATAYLNDEDEFILYFALERSGNEGDGNVGFWFMQDGTIGCDNSTGKTASFTGNHKDGDLLIVSEFSNGGDVSTIQVYKWEGGADGALNETPIVTGADCKTTPEGGVGDTACATVNGSLIPSSEIPWLTETKQPGNTPSNDLDVSKFFEGGVNLTANNLEACFSTFMGVTRSSTSLTATIFDYALGSFPVCAIKVAKTCDVTKLIRIDDGEGGPVPVYQVNFSGAVTNDGLAPISADEIIKVIDNAGSDDTPNIDVFGANGVTVGSLTAGAAWEPDTDIEFSGSFESTENPPYNTVRASVTIAGSAEPISAEYSVDCAPLDLTPALDVTKECTESDLVAYNGVLALQNSYTIEVCNTATSPLLNVNINDTTAGYSTSLSILDAPKECNNNFDCGDGDGTSTCYTTEYGQCAGGAYAGNYCTADSQCPESSCDLTDTNELKQCLDDELGQLGLAVCNSHSDTYYPAETTGEDYSSTNTVTVTADDPVSGETVYDSASGTCTLCL